MAERRLNGHAEIGTRIRVTAENDGTTDGPIPGAEGEIFGFRWGYAWLRHPDHDMWLNPDEYEVID
jgi:hypothetical protein